MESHYDMKRNVDWLCVATGVWLKQEPGNEFVTKDLPLKHRILIFFLYIEAQNWLGLLKASGRNMTGRSNCSATTHPRKAGIKRRLH